VTSSCADDSVSVIAGLNWSTISFASNIAL
jgi:hypothetical protein